MRREQISCEQRFRVFERDGFCCVYCGRSAKDGSYISAAFHADHVYPYTRGGSNSDENLVTACSDCNIGKGDSVIARLPPGLPSSVVEHYFTYFDHSCGVDEPDRFRLDPLERHVIEMLMYVPESVDVIVHHSQNEDRWCEVTRQVIGAADRLRFFGLGSDFESLMVELTDETSKNVLVGLHADRKDCWQLGQNEQCVRIRELEECFMRRSAERRMRAAASALKTPDLDVGAEAELLACLVANRRVAQGM